MIALDTETTGVDFHHGAKPFMVTTCDEQGVNLFWEWHVDPLTREPQIPEEDKEEIRTRFVNAKLGKALNIGPVLVLQNTKFDVHALASIGLTDFNWNRYYDTLLAGHLLASNHRHDLTSMAVDFLGENIESHEKALEKATKEARRLCRTKDFIERHGEWMIAKEDLSCMPSAGETTWKYDTWLPRAVAKAEDYPKPDGECEHEWDDDICMKCEGHSWWLVLRLYANTDSAITLMLWKAQRRAIEERGLWKIYAERLKILPAVYAMECRGITLSGERLENLIKEYTEDSGTAAAVLCNIADEYKYPLQLPKGASPNNSLRTFIFDFLKLEKITDPKSKTGNPSLNKAVLDHYEATLPERSMSLEFIRTLKGKRSRDTAIAYMQGYKRYWKPYLTDDVKLDMCFKPSGGLLFKDFENYYVIYPSVNPTGTDTLRSSSNNPNEQNISKKESFNLRYCFGPLPGREWWSLDYQNLELRIPAFDAGEIEMVNLFLNPKEPPYYGSYHLLIFDTLHPEKFAKYGKECKTVYESTWYQWTKNGNFAVQYGAQESSGTADRAYHVPGAQRRIQSRFKKIKELGDRMMKHAEQYGYVVTMPDKSVDPDHGYPLLCTCTQWGKILPTVPLSYRVQGTACDIKGKALVKCHAKLEEWRRDGFDGYVIMDVHDELVFDFPKSKKHPKEDPKRSNLWRIRELKAIMEQCGDNVGVPTPVDLEYNEFNWSEGVKI